MIYLGKFNILCTGSGEHFMIADIIVMNSESNSTNIVIYIIIPDYYTSELNL